MSYQRPSPGRYRRKADGADVDVVGSTGWLWNDWVTVRSGTRTWHVQLRNFWHKYEPWTEDPPGGAS